MKIKILRVVKENKFISADTFENSFKKFSATKFLIDYISPEKINNLLIKSYENNRTQIKSIFEKYDFFCPGFGAFEIIPVFLMLRNRLNLNIKLLFISHAPGGHIFQFIFMEKLMKSGDLIIAPTKNAAKIISTLSPYLGNFTKIINHPIELNFTNLEFNEKINEKYFVSFTRIHPDKLLHKAIDAIYLLKKSGKNIKYFIAGNIYNEKGEKSLYTRILIEKIKSLKLENDIFLMGEIKDLKKKFFYLKNAVALINLSISVEESFGKSITESICSGTPVIATKWNGFKESCGKCGILIPVSVKNEIIDVDVLKIAEAMEYMLNNKDKYRDRCKEFSKKFKITNIEDKYFNLLKNSDKINMIFHKNKKKYLLEYIPLFKDFTQEQLQKIYTEYFETNIVENYGKFTFGLLLSQIVPLMVKREIKSLLSMNNITEKYFSFNHIEFPKKETDFFYKLLNSVFYKSTCYAKEILLLSALRFVDIDYFEKVFNILKKIWPKDNKKGIFYIEIEIKILKKRFKSAALLWNNYFKNWNFQENDYILLRQIAKIYRLIGTPDYALDFLKNWLKKYRFSEYSFPIWTDLCINSIEAGIMETAEEALEMIKLLSEDTAFTEKLERMFYASKISLVK